MIGPMAGKAPLLLAMVLFVVGAAGLGLSSAERASWGPFQPPNPGLAEQNVVIAGGGRVMLEPPSLVELLEPFETAIASAEPELEATTAAPPAPLQAAVEPTATPVAPLKIFGISADDGGVSAAGTTPEAPPPIRIGGISYDDDVVSDSPTDSVVEAEPTAEPEPPAEPTPEKEPTENTPTEDEIAPSAE